MPCWTARLGMRSASCCDDIDAVMEAWNLNAIVKHGARLIVVALQLYVVITTLLNTPRKQLPAMRFSTRTFRLRTLVMSICRVFCCNPRLILAGGRSRLMRGVALPRGSCQTGKSPKPRDACKNAQRLLEHRFENNGPLIRNTKVFLMSCIRSCFITAMV
jgi:hypothetical protein